MSDRADELARLDAEIASVSPESTSEDRWRAANAAYAKAELLGGVDGGKEALDAYRSCIELLREQEDRDAVWWSIYVANAMAIIYERWDDPRLGPLLEPYIAEHFDDPHPEYAGAMASASLMYARTRLLDPLQVDEGRALLRRILAVYGKPSVEGYEYTASVARQYLAQSARDTGDEESAYDQFSRLLGDLRELAPGESLRQLTDPGMRDVAAASMVALAEILESQGRHDEANVVLDELVRTFRDDAEAEHASFIVQRIGEVRPRRRRWPPRRA